MDRELWILALTHWVEMTAPREARLVGSMPRFSFHRPPALEVRLPRREARPAISLGVFRWVDLNSIVRQYIASAYPGCSYWTCRLDLAS